MPMPLPLHIIEPTLTGDAGHCHSLIRALAGAAAPRTDLTVWAGAPAAAFWQGPGRLAPIFQRRWRRLQAFWLVRRLLRQPGRILIATAGTADLVSAHWAANGVIPPHKLFLFVHWLNAKPSKARRLAAMAQRQPHLEILAPSPSVADFFRQCGFKATLVPYPLEAQAAPAAGASPVFKHLLVAGAARLDKGFAQVVDLVAEMQHRDLICPITVQTSVEQRHQHDQALGQQLARLQAIGYTGLRTPDQAMDPAAYRALFDGAIVVQPYRAQDFQDRISGVTLDALAAGCPVVVTAGTWAAQLVQRFEAGIATDDVSADGLLRAISPIQQDFARYAGNAQQAAASVRAEHSAQGLIDAVLAGVGAGAGTGTGTDTGTGTGRSVDLASSPGPAP